MKVIAHDWGQCLYVVSADEVRPLGGLHYPTFLAALAERYAFAGLPNLHEVVEQNVSKFENGRLPDNHELVVRLMQIYADGVIISANDTDIVDTILDDFVSFLESQFSFRPPETPATRTYSSTVVVEFDGPLEAMLKNAEGMKDVMSAAFSSATGHDAQFGLSLFRFNADPALLPVNTNSTFLIEHRAGSTFGQRRFFSSAPLRTDDHISYLQSLEQIVS